MTKAEMKTKYATLYSIMANSKKVANMKLFGSVMSDAIDALIEYHPDVAEKFIERLCAVKWNNYLTQAEADLITRMMIPAAHWTYEDFKSTVDKLGGVLEQEPCYNSYALWVAMNMVYSDSAETITSIIGTNSPDQIANAVYLLATDKLCDEDGVFDIRKYFNV